MILLNEEEIKELLTMDECIPAVEQAFNLLGQEQAYNLPRGRIRTEPFEEKYSYWAPLITAF